MQVCICPFISAKGSSPNIITLIALSNINLFNIRKYSRVPNKRGGGGGGGGRLLTFGKMLIICDIILYL